MKILCWMTGYTNEQLYHQVEKEISYETFFAEAPHMNPGCKLIKGSVCGIKVEHIEDPLMQKIRWLDKLVDELAKGKSMDKILRKEEMISRAALPEAEERISWSMPTYWKEHNILHFAAQKKHIGFYPGPAAVIHFEKELKTYSTDKGTIRIPYEKIDGELIAKIAKWCYETDNHA